jgi:hypothetical protein
MRREVQTRWIAAPTYEKALEFAVKRGKDLAMTYDAGLRMLEKARAKACWGWKLYEIRFIIEIEETH